MNDRQKDLLLSILAMDSYNQGYAPSVIHGKAAIGTATFIRGDVSDAAQAAGFYAAEYTLSSGETVISYRGTDNTSLFIDPIKGGSDIAKGWLAGVGEPTSQTDLALDFYETVTGHSVFDGMQSNVTLTGHSLGGGLAQLASLLSGTTKF